MKESYFGGTEKRETNKPPESTQRNTRDNTGELLRMAEGSLIHAKNAYADAAARTPENLRATEKLTQYNMEAIPLPDGSRARRIDIINGRASYEEDLATRIADLTNAASIAETGEPRAFLIFGQKKRAAWESKRDETRKALADAKRSMAEFQQLKKDIAEAAERLEFISPSGRMAESLRLQEMYEAELNKLRSIG